MVTKNKIEIIEETVDYYSENSKERRGVDEGACVYINEDGKMCAVGRCLENPIIVEELAQKSNGTSVGYLKRCRINIEDYFKEEYKGHELTFWEDLQNFHDSSWFWGDSGLTVDGLEKVSKLKEKYK